MPYYYFHIWLGHEAIEDGEGLMLPDRAAAIAQALSAMREMLGEDIRMGRLDLTMEIRIHDAGGAFHVVDCQDAMARAVVVDPGGSGSDPGRVLH